MSQTFFTSDLHFGHANALRFDNRPWDTIEEMNEALIENWNQKVGKNDLVFIIGDFLWKSDEAALDILKRLNGRLVLICGNHDKFVKKPEFLQYFEAVKDYDDIKVGLKSGENKRCILCHYFMPMYNGHYRGAILLHGHSHDTHERQEELRIAKELNEKGIPCEAYNCFCGFYQWAPATLDEIMKRWETDNDSAAHGQQ